MKEALRMEQPNPWREYRQEGHRRRLNWMQRIQIAIAVMLFLAVWLVPMVNPRWGEVSGQLVWRTTREVGDFSQMWGQIESWRDSMMRQPWFDSVRAVTARPVSPFHYLEKPVEGTLVVPFGKAKDGVVHDTVEWEVATGSEVKAVSAGKVIDIVRNDAVGNRTLVMQSGPMTIHYGYLAESWVSVGDLVTRGQTIGRSGMKEGKYSRMSLAIREKGQAIDPLERITDIANTERGK